MSNGDMKRLTTVFNLADPYQRELYEYAKQFTNYSAYSKSLIQRDMDAKVKPAEWRADN